MRLMNKAIVLASVLAFSTSGCSDDSGGTTGSGGSAGASAGGSGGQAGQQDIVDTAVAAGSFTTLVAAVQAADLESTLRSAGPFTVFAPTDDAFDALPEGTVEDLLKPENKATLTGILTYHAVAGEVLAADVVTLDSATTVNGADISVEVVDGEVILNGNVKVITTDIQASNGVIHVINGVLLPPEG